MKINWNYIKAFALLGLIVFLYSFSSARNKRRNLNEVKVQFLASENLYVTETAVNKLFIQNNADLKNVPKEVSASSQHSIYPN